MEYKVKVVNAVADIPQVTWDALAEGEGPFLRYDFLNALEQSACCDEASGWFPQHLVIEQAQTTDQAAINKDACPSRPFMGKCLPPARYSLLPEMGCRYSFYAGLWFANSNA